MSFWEGQILTGQWQPTFSPEDLTNTPHSTSPLLNPPTSVEMGNTSSTEMAREAIDSVFGNNMKSVPEVREKYRQFRILVIGRANAGKTTLLKRVCNTDEDPCIYDKENENLVRFPLSPGTGGLLLTVDTTKTVGADRRGLALHPLSIESHVLTLVAHSVESMTSVVHLASRATQASSFTTPQVSSPATTANSKKFSLSSLNEQRPPK